MINNKLITGDTDFQKKIASFKIQEPVYLNF